MPQTNDWEGEVVEWVLHQGRLIIQVSHNQRLGGWSGGIGITPRKTDNLSQPSFCR